MLAMAMAWRDKRGEARIDDDLALAFYSLIPSVSLLLRDHGLPAP